MSKNLKEYRYISDFLRDLHIDFPVPNVAVFNFDEHPSRLGVYFRANFYAIVIKWPSNSIATTQSSKKITSVEFYVPGQIVDNTSRKLNNATIILIDCLVVNSSRLLPIFSAIDNQLADLMSHFTLNTIETVELKFATTSLREVCLRVPLIKLKELVIDWLYVIVELCQNAARRHSSDDILRSKIVNDFAQELDDYLDKGKGIWVGVPRVAYFAEKANLSSQYFSELVKAKANVSPLEIINNKVIEYSKWLLGDSQLTVADVAHFLGYQNPQHFISFFKKKTKMTPGEYRSSLK